MLDRVNMSTRVLALARQFAYGLPNEDGLAQRASLPDAGLTSMAAVKLMLAIEAEFQIAIPDEALTPENFATVASVEALIDRLR
jgi:acyl carrier protein